MLFHEKAVLLQALSEKNHIQITGETPLQYRHKNLQ
jgi:hypothetical protein